MNLTRPLPAPYDPVAWARKPFSERARQPWMAA